MKPHKGTKTLKPRKATRENALKAAEYCAASNQRLTVGWYEESWLYDGTGGLEVLESMVAEGLLVVTRDNGLGARGKTFYARWFTYYEKVKGSNNG